MTSQAPSAARIRRAWRAGLRVGSTRLALGLGLGLVGLWLQQPWSARPVSRPWVERGREVLAGGGANAGEFLHETVLGGVIGWTLLVAAVVLTLLVAGLLMRRLGPVDRRSGQALEMSGPVRIPLGLGVVVACVMLGWGLWILSDLLAGAARAVDSSGPGLATLWRTAIARTLQWLGAGMIVLALAEAWVVGRAQRLALGPGDPPKPTRGAS